MNYELAKKLKDAGYPVKYSADKCIGAVPNLEAKKLGEDFFIGLSLSELIKECGNNMSALTRENGKWSAWQRIYTIPKRNDGENDKEISNVRFGETPEEAVANLYIALHV